MSRCFFSEEKRMIDYLSNKRPSKEEMLVEAFYRDWLDAAHILLKRKPDLRHIVDGESGESLPVYIVVLNRRWALRLLLKHGVDPNTRDTKGNTLLMTAVQCAAKSTDNDKRRYRCVKLLLKKGASVTEFGEDEKNAMDLAVEFGDKKLIALLKRYIPPKDGKNK